MAATRTIVLFLAAIAVGALALQLGAGVQKEEYFEPTPEHEDRDSMRAGGNLVMLTSLLAGLGFAAAVATLGRRRSDTGMRRMRRLGLAAGAALGAWILGILLQSAWFTVVQVDVDGAQASALLSINPFIAHTRAAPSLLVPLLAAGVGAVALTTWSVVRLWRPARPFDLPRLHRLHLAATAAGAVLVAAAAAGASSLVVGAARDAGGYQLVLPLQAVALLGLVATALLRARHQEDALLEPRLAAAAQEAHMALRRVDIGLLAMLVATMFLVQLFPPEPLDQLEAAFTFGLTLRTHSQLLPLAAAPLLAGLLLHPRQLQALEGHRTAVETVPGTGGLLVACVAGTVAAIVVAFLTGWSTWPVLVAAVPVAAYCAIRLPASLAAPALGIVALLLWGLGNSTYGVVTFTSFSELRLGRSSGVLALWRVVAALTVAALVARGVRALGKEAPPRDAVPASFLAGAATVVLLLVELPLGAWIVHRGSGDSLAVGSLAHSFDPTVLIGLRVLDFTLVLLAAFRVARLLRPDWFERRPRPAPAPAGVRAV